MEIVKLLLVARSITADDINKITRFGITGDNNYNTTHYCSSEENPNYKNSNYKNKF